MNNLAFIEDGGSYEIQAEERSVSLLEIYNAGPDTVYYFTQEPSLTISCTTVNASLYVTVNETIRNRLRQGMFVSGPGMPANAQIQYIHGNRITLWDGVAPVNATASGTADLTFDMEAIVDGGDSALNGMPIGMGETKSFATDGQRPLLQAPLLLSVGSGEQAYIRIHKRFN